MQGVRKFSELRIGGLPKPKKRQKPGIMAVWKKIEDRISGDNQLQNELRDVFINKLRAGYWPAWSDTLDRVMGKATQQVNIDVQHVVNPLEGLQGDQLLDAARRLLNGEIGTIPQLIDLEIESSKLLDAAQATYDAEDQEELAANKEAACFEEAEEEEDSE